ncbi:MAG: universal stress protein [Thermoleophilaceae bacterium]
MESQGVRKILVCANETVGGRALIEAVKRHAQSGPISVFVCCPQNEPRHGYVVYDDTVREAAENRLKTTIAQLAKEGIEATGEVLGPDPYSAIMDCVRDFDPDEIIISTHPETRSGWLRRDLISRVRDTTGLPVEHVVVDLDLDRKEATRTLVVANQTAGGEPLFGLLRGKAAEKPHSFIVILPQSGADQGDAHARLAALLSRLHAEGFEAIGQVFDPDPFTAIQNALQFYAVDEIVISTFPATRSGWLRSDLVDRVRASTALPVEHVVVSEAQASEAA